MYMHGFKKWKMCYFLVSGFFNLLELYVFLTRGTKKINKNKRHSQISMETNSNLISRKGFFFWGGAKLASENAFFLWHAGFSKYFYFQHTRILTNIHIIKYSIQFYGLLYKITLMIGTILITELNKFDSHQVVYTIVLY